MSAPIISHDAQLVDVSTLKRFRGNARIGNLDVIRESLRINGQYRPIVVRSQTREVLAGNHTWEAAKLEDWTQIWATFITCDAQTARRINLVDNRSQDLGLGYDEEALMKQLSATPDLTGTGWSDSDRDKLASKLILGVGGDTDPVPLPPEPQTQPGDLILLGEHRLLCGDSTDAKDVLRLMESADEKPSCLWTDPPFGTGGADKVPGNDPAGLQDLLAKAYELADQALAGGAALYILRPSNKSGTWFSNAFLAAGWRFRQTLVWDKGSSAFGRHDYHYQHELIDYGFTQGDSRGRFGRAEDSGWYGDDHQPSILQFPRAKESVMLNHPLIKSVPLVELCLRNSTRRGAWVFEPFCGSGTTLIAAQNMNRRCVAMEIDPGYCDVIIERWERHTVAQAEVIRS